MKLRISPFFALLLAAGTLWYGLEVAWSLWTASALPLGPEAFLVGWLLVAGWTLFLAGLVPVLERRVGSKASTLILLGLCALLIVAKVRLVLGARPLPVVSLLYLLIPLALVALAPVLGRRGNPAGAGLILLIVGILSTDVLKVFWLQTRGMTLREVMVGSTAGVILLGVLAAGQHFGSGLAGRGRRRAPLLLTAAMLAAAVGGTLLYLVGVPRALPSQVRPGTPPASPERVTLEGQRAIDDLPNIILISIDTLRWDMVPPRARERLNLRLPSLRELWKDSIDFTRAYSTTGWTLPSHASLFTGELPVRHRAVKLNASEIRPESTTYTSYLRQVGYHTAGFTDDGAVSRSFGFDRGFDLYWEQKPSSTPTLPLKKHFLPGPVELSVALSRTLPDGTPSLRRPLDNRPYLNDVASVTDWTLPFLHSPPIRIPSRTKLRFFRRNLHHARHWIRSHASSSRPFFLFLHTYQVHDYGYARAEKPLYPGDVDYLERYYPAPLMAYPDVLEDRRSLHPDPPPTVDVVWQRFQRLEIPGLNPNHRRRFRERLGDLSEKDREPFRDHLRLWNRRGDEVFELMVERLQIRVMAQSPRVWQRFLNRPPKYKRSILGPGEDALRALTMTPIQARLTKHFMYRHMVKSIDEKLGGFLDHLKERGLYEDSLILFISDHGQGFEVTDRTDGHCCGQLSEVLLKIPIWMKLPEKQSAGTTVQRRIQIQDVFPMTLDHLGIRREGKPWFSQSRVSRRVPFRLPEREVLLGSSTVGIHHADPKHFRVFAHDGRYKAIKDSRKSGVRFWRVHPANPHQFEVPRAAVPPRSRKELLEALRGHAELFGPSNPYLEEDEKIEGKLRENLKGLGYL